MLALVRFPLWLHTQVSERTLQRPLQQMCRSRPSTVMNYRKFWTWSASLEASERFLQWHCWFSKPENIGDTYSICVIGKHHHFHITPGGDCLAARFMRYFGKLHILQYILSKLHTSPSQILQLLRAPCCPFGCGSDRLQKEEEEQANLSSFMDLQRCNVRGPAVTHGRTPTSMGRP